MKILFICSGNICRSPTAEGWFRRLAPELAPHARFEVDSAGTHGLHAGEPPDPRTLAAARRRGLDLSALRAREVRRDDFERFDWMLAMDESHRRWLERNAPAGARARVQLMLEFAPALGRREVPDPYYGGPAGFELVLDVLEPAVRGLIEAIAPRPSR